MKMIKLTARFVMFGLIVALSACAGGGGEAETETSPMESPMESPAEPPMESPMESPTTSP